MSLSSSGNPAPVLLCESDRDLRLALAGLLERAGHRAILAADARQAVSTAMADPPACMVLSLPIANGDSTEILRSLRGMAGLSHTPVILLAPPGLLPAGLPGFRPGVDRCFSHTVRPLELLAAVAHAVGE